MSTREPLKAIKPFYSEEQGCLQVTVGETFKLIKNVNDDWLYCRSLVSKKIGYVPTWCVEQVRAESVSSQTSSAVPDLLPYSKCRTMFTFNSKAENQLGFQQGEELLILRVARGGWYYARNAKGEEGKIPGNFVTPMTSGLSATATSESANTSSALNVDLKGIPRRAAPAPPRHMSSGYRSSMPTTTTTTTLDYLRSKTQEKRTYGNTDLKALNQSFSTAMTITPGSTQKDIIDLQPLVQEVRDRTGISHTQSVKAVTCVVDYLRNHLPQGMVDQLELKYPELEWGKGIQQDKQQTQTEDERRLEVILSELYEHANDAQQQNWAIYNDSPVLLEYLTELQSLLQDANVSTCRKVLQVDGYVYTDALMNYYQKDARVEVRKELLKTYGAIGLVDKNMFNRSLLTNLPIELAITLSNQDEWDEFTYYTLVFSSMLFSMGAKIPMEFYTHWNQELIQRLIGYFVADDGSSLSSLISDSSLSLILAFNLHFDPANPMEIGHMDNIAMDAFLASDGVAHAAITERLLILANRNEDPVQLPITENDNSEESPNSVLKMLQDLFSRKRTAAIFFTNDLKVLLEIILRELQNLAPLDKMRIDWLRVLYGLLLNTDYSEHRYLENSLYAPLTDLADNPSHELVSIEERILSTKILEIFSLMN